jgi:hypothetical protein
MDINGFVMNIDGFIVDIDPFRVIELTMINWIAG